MIERARLRPAGLVSSQNDCLAAVAAGRPAVLIRLRAAVVVEDSAARRSADPGAWTYRSVVSFDVA